MRNTCIVTRHLVSLTYSLTCLSHLKFYKGFLLLELYHAILVYRTCTPQSNCSCALRALALGDDRVLSPCVSTLVYCDISTLRGGAQQSWRSRATIETQLFGPMIYESKKIAAPFLTEQLTLRPVPKREDFLSAMAVPTLKTNRSPNATG